MAKCLNLRPSKAPGKALKGEMCHSKRENTGCREGLRCSKPPNKEWEECLESWDCWNDGITCGALKLVGSIATAIAVASTI